MTPEERDRMIRVNHAGERGACALYRGQRAILGQHPRTGPLLETMADQEAVHQQLFEAHMKNHHGRPSLLLPLWDALGYGLGAVSALMGQKAAMACTAAVEDVIDQHYQNQLAALDPDDPDTLPLRETILHCHADELHHRDTALDHGAEAMRGHRVFQALVRGATRIAIAVAKRV